MIEIINIFASTLPKPQEPTLITMLRKRAYKANTERKIV